MTLIMSGTPKGISHRITNILDQAETTTISIGPTQGYFISQKQFDELERCAKDLSEVQTLSVHADSDSDDNSRQYLQTQSEQLRNKIKKWQGKLAIAPRSEKPKINEQIGRFQSDLARVSKVLDKLEL